MCRWDNILFSYLHMNHPKKMEIGSKWDASIVMEVPVFLSNKSRIWDFDEKTKNCLVIVLLLVLGRIIVGNFCLTFHLFCPVVSVISAEEQTRTKQLFLVPELQFALPKLFSNVFPVVRYCHTVAIAKEYYEPNKKFVRLFVLWCCGRWSSGRDKLQESQMLRMKQGASSREIKRELILLFNPVSLRSKWAVRGNLAFS